MVYEELVQIARCLDQDYRDAEAFRIERHALWKLGIQILVNTLGGEPHELIVRRHDGEVLLRVLAKEEEDGKEAKNNTASEESGDIEAEHQK